MAQFCRLTLAGPEGPDRGKKIFRSGMWLGRSKARKSRQRHPKDQGCKRQPTENPEFSGDAAAAGEEAGPKRGDR
jgi:hypothetical protein